MPTWSQIMFQDANSPIMEQVMFCYDNTMIILMTIALIVGWTMIKMMFNKKINRFMMDNQMIEFILTVIPAIILIFIALHSLGIMYLTDEIKNPMITIKAVGHQWYWSHEYSDFKNVEFEYYMKPDNLLSESEFRLIETDNRTVLPMDTKIRIIVTAENVLHSWAMSSLGMNIDATPGRLNQGAMFINRPGLMFGQCSEICGENNWFMGITIEIIN